MSIWNFDIEKNKIETIVLKKDKLNMGTGFEDKKIEVLKDEDEFIKRQIEILKSLKEKEIEIVYAINKKKESGEMSLKEKNVIKEVNQDNSIRLEYEHKGKIDINKIRKIKTGF
jgi:hypothetical protein